MPENNEPTALSYDHITMRFYYLPIILIAFTAACSTTRTPVRPPVNTSFTVQINQSFDSLPNYSRIYFQAGKHIPKGGLDKWTTYCRLHVYNPDKKADYLTAVAAGSFGVSRVSNRVESSDTPVSGSGIYGSVGIRMSHFASPVGLNRVRSDGPPAFYLYRVEMTLSSAQQPDVQTLICSKKWATRGNYYPTLVEIRRALGEQIELTPLSISATSLYQVNSVYSEL